MPTPISPALILKRGADKLSLTQVHELQANAGLVQKILTGLEEAAEVAREARKSAETARVELERQTEEANAALQRRENALAEDRAAFEEERSAFLVEKEGQADAHQAMMKEAEALRVEAGTERRKLDEDRAAFISTKAVEEREIRERKTKLAEDEKALAERSRNFDARAADHANAVARLERDREALRQREASLKAILDGKPLRVATDG